MILSGIPISDNECIGDSLSNINNAFLTLSAFSNVIVGAGNPTVVSSFVGQEYLDSSTSIFYKASAVGSSSSWVPLN